MRRRQARCTFARSDLERSYDIFGESHIEDWPNQPMKATILYCKFSDVQLNLQTVWWLISSR